MCVLFHWDECPLCTTPLLLFCFFGFHDGITSRKFDLLLLSFFLENRIFINRERNEIFQKFVIVAFRIERIAQRVIFLAFLCYWKASSASEIGSRMTVLASSFCAAEAWHVARDSSVFRSFSAVRMIVSFLCKKPKFCRTRLCSSVFCTACKAVDPRLAAAV